MRYNRGVAHEFSSYIGHKVGAPYLGHKFGVPGETRRNASFYYRVAA